MSKDGPCLRCHNLSIPCGLVGNLSPGPWTPQNTHHGQVRPLLERRYPRSDAGCKNYTEECVFPTWKDRKELIRLYFRHVHDKHHSLFHQPTLEVELKNGQVPDILVYAMMALGIRLARPVQT